MDTGERTFIANVGNTGSRDHRFKVNDLYLTPGAIRDISLDPRVSDVLATLLGDAPVLCNTLNFERGSAQDDHIDSLYMTPETPGNLVAIWVALENTHPDAGPLRYYPGSHRIPLFRFSDGGHHSASDEMPAWTAHVRRHVDEAGLQPETFLARRGDLFIWHANLLHGGSAIRSRDLTCKSLVSHYWTHADCRARNMDMVPGGRTFWFCRPHQPVRSARWRERIAPAARRLRRFAGSRG